MTQAAEKFARHRSVEEVVDLARQKGIRVNVERYNLGSDFITVELPGRDGKPIPVMYNVFNGRFFSGSREPFSYFASDRTDHDGQPWFDAMLEFFYVPKEPA
jgi:hypothetical protein